MKKILKKLLHLFEKIIKINKPLFKRYCNFKSNFKHKLNERRIKNFPQKELNRVYHEYPKIMSYKKMLKMIMNGASLARLADVELVLIMGDEEFPGFQSCDPKLRRRLIEIIERPSNKKLLIGIPPFPSLKIVNNEYSFWQKFLTQNWNRYRDHILHRRYACCAFTREAGINALGIENIIKIWENREVVFVVPKDGLFHFDKRMYGNIKHIDYIYCPATYAFAEYDRILSDCKKFSKDKIFLICAGPTATVLATDLSDLGYQAIDLGKLQNAYAFLLGEKKHPEYYMFNKE